MKILIYLTSNCSKVAFKQSEQRFFIGCQVPKQLTLAKIADSHYSLLIYNNHNTGEKTTIHKDMHTYSDTECCCCVASLTDRANIVLDRHLTVQELYWEQGATMKHWTELKEGQTHGSRLFSSLDWLFSDIKDLPQGIVLLTSLVHKKTLVVPESNYWWNDWLPWKVREAIEVNRQPSFFSCLQALKWNAFYVSHSDYIRILEKMPADILFFPVVWNWNIIHYTWYVMMHVRKRRYGVLYKITITTHNKLLIFTLTQQPELLEQLGYCHHAFFKVHFPFLQYRHWWYWTIKTASK